mmetsp:Transcript_100736/g.260242  ORF Transcript_100736/g.260242 Transcript_100736/m.260242 type:complete len:223 (-) Transcript_100736:76-744(-)
MIRCAMRGGRSGTTALGGSGGRSALSAGRGRSMRCGGGGAIDPAVRGGGCRFLLSCGGRRFLGSSGVVGTSVYGEGSELPASRSMRVGGVRGIRRAWRGGVAAGRPFGGQHLCRCARRQELSTLVRLVTFHPPCHGLRRCVHCYPHLRGAPMRQGQRASRGVAPTGLCGRDAGCEAAVVPGQDIHCKSAGADCRWGANEDDQRYDGRNGARHCHESPWSAIV